MCNCPYNFADCRLDSWYASLKANIVRTAFSLGVMLIHLVCSDSNYNVHFFEFFEQ